MKVKLIKESSGLGYRSNLVSWLVSNEENLAALDRLSQNLEVDIPKEKAKLIYNLVDVETGEVISNYSNLTISKNEIKKRYQNKKYIKQAEVKTEIRKIISTLDEQTKPIQDPIKFKTIKGVST